MPRSAITEITPLWPRAWVGRARFPQIAFLVATVLATHAALGEEWFYLSNEGTATLLVKQPDIHRVSDKSQQLGLVPNRTEVEVLESSRDASIPSLEWKKIRVLTGHLRETTGWVSSNRIIRSGTPRPVPKKIDAAGARELAKGTSVVVASATQLRRDPDLRRPDITEPRLTLETRLVRLNPNDVRTQEAGGRIEWIEVEVVDGPHAGKRGWVVRHQVRELPRLLIFAIYYEVADRAFERAARTAIAEIESQLASGGDSGTSGRVAFGEAEYDTLLLGVGTKPQFLSAWKQVKEKAEEEHFEIYYGALLTHASIQDDRRDGLEFSGGETGSTLAAGEIATLPVLPWSRDARGLYLHGCNTGAYEYRLTRRGWCPAEVFANSQAVTAWGQVGFSYFSTSPDRYVPQTPADGAIYLFAYYRGRNSPIYIGNGLRIPHREFKAARATSGAP
jgi:hypothetical protein